MLRFGTTAEDQVKVALKDATTIDNNETVFSFSFSSDSPEMGTGGIDRLEANHVIKRLKFVSLDELIVRHTVVHYLKFHCSSRGSTRL